MDLSALVNEDVDAGIFRIHRSALTSAEIMDLEQERIFDRCWLYVGHETEIPKAGDYRRRTLGKRPLIFVRGNDGEIRVFFNACLHRGALVCRQDSGSAGAFQCFYHGWSYTNVGKLSFVPDADGYSDSFKKVDQALGQPAHVDNYRGFYFVNFAQDAPSLADYLGETRKIIDLTLDSAEPLGGWRAVPGTARYDIRANWKLLAENSVDNYHFHTVHRSYSDYIKERRKRSGAAEPSVNRITDSRSLAYAHGHVGMLTYSAGRPIANASPLWSAETAAEVKRVRNKLIDQFGDDRGARMADMSRFLIIFPNLAFQDTQSGFRLRQWWPTAPDRMEVIQWEFAPPNERKDVADYRAEGAVTFQGPGGFGTPDDIEALESCQIGFQAREMEWSDMSRGMKRTPRSDDELTARGFWRQWHGLIQRQTDIRTSDLPSTDTNAVSV